MMKGGGGGLVGDHVEMEAKNEESQNARPLQRAKAKAHQQSAESQTKSERASDVKAACQKGPTAEGAAVCFEAKAQIPTALVHTADGRFQHLNSWPGPLPK
ncbi:hypothetical protein L1887_47052 [Cichorium endivia]|nr:hypothetical protein L1887_47052 [Cichorium endivia]